MKKTILLLILFTNSYATDVIGQGFIKQHNGHVITCAGNKVYLESKNTPLSQSIINATIKLNGQQTRLTRFKNAVNSGYPGYKEKYKDALKVMSLYKKEADAIIKQKKFEETLCDSGGNFEFFDITPGDYTLGTVVEWYVLDEYQGGYLMKHITVGKKKKRYFLTK